MQRGVDCYVIDVGRWPRVKRVDNTSNKYDDVLVQGKITVGTSPTASTLILVYVWGSDTSLATTAL